MPGRSMLAMAGALMIAALAVPPTQGEARARQKTPKASEVQTGTKERKLAESEYRDLEIIRSHEGRTVLEGCKGTQLQLLVVDQQDNTILTEVGLGPCPQRRAEAGFRTTELVETTPLDDAVKQVADLRPPGEPRGNDDSRSRAERERSGSDPARSARNAEDWPRPRGPGARGESGGDELPRSRLLADRGEGRLEDSPRARPLPERNGSRLDEPRRSRSLSDRDDSRPDEPPRSRPFAERSEPDTGEPRRARPLAESGTGRAEDAPRPRSFPDRFERNGEEPAARSRGLDGDSLGSLRERGGTRLGAEGDRFGADGRSSQLGGSPRETLGGGERLGARRDGDLDPGLRDREFKSREPRDRDRPFERNREASTSDSRFDFGERERERHGRSFEPRGARLDPEEIPVKMCARGYTQVTVVDDRPPRMLVEGCRGDTRYRIALDRNGEVVDQESLGPCRSRLFGIGLDEVYGAMRRLFRGERNGEQEYVGGQGARS